MSKFDTSKLDRMNPDSKQYKNQCDRIDHGTARMALKDKIPEDSMDDAAAIKLKEQQDRRRTQTLSHASGSLCRGLI